jgi:hypothetical protein
MNAGEWITVQSVAIQKAGHDARPLAASPTANMWRVASARKRRAQRAFMSPAEFIALVAGWGAGLVLLLFVSILARYLSERGGYLS